MGGYVAATWGRDEEVQRGFHARAFDPGRWQVITAAGIHIGMLSVERRPGEVYLARIEILSDYQGQGIGTGLIGALAADAAGRGKNLVLDVLNVRARALYERLGSEETGRHGDNEAKVTMRLLCPSREAGPGD